MKDKEIKKLAKEFLEHIAVEGVKRQEQLLIQFGREVAHRTTLWAHGITMDAVPKSAAGSMRADRLAPLPGFFWGRTTMKKKPTVAEVRAELDIHDEDSMPVKDHLALRRLVLALKAERERQGLSLADVSLKSRITAPALSKLETGQNPNPTVNTLLRYAEALGKGIKIEIE